MSQYNQEKELLINITKPNIQDDDTKLMLRSGGNSKRNPLPFHKRIERFRLWFKDFLEKYELDKLMDFLELIFSLYFFVTFIFYTYQTQSQEWVYVSELCVGSFFFFDWKFRGMFLAEQKLRFLFSLESLVDLATIFPVIPMSYLLSSHSLWFQWGQSFWRVLFSLRAFRIYFKGRRVLRRKFKFLSLSPLQRKVLETYLLLFSLLLFAASIAIATPWIPAMSQFHDAIYWIFLTATTIGYPDATLFMGKLLTLVFVVGLTVIVPVVVLDVTSLLSRTSKYGGSYRPSSSRSFVLICGAIEYPAIRDFLCELLHPEHGSTRISHVVLLSPREPSEELEAEVLKEPRYASSVTYLNGSALSTHDLLERVNVQHAQAVFILCDSRDDPNEVDATVTCLTLKIRSVAPNVKIFAEIRNPENKANVILAGATHVLCVHELQMSLLGQSCLCPGFSTLVTNLTRTWTPQRSFPPTTWLHHFSHGLSQEMYETKVSPVFRGTNYFQLAELFYKRFQITLIALRKGRTVVSPIEKSNSVYVVTGGEYALVIASDQITAHKISEISTVSKQDITFNHNNFDQPKEIGIDDEMIGLDIEDNETSHELTSFPYHKELTIKTTTEKRSLTVALLQRIPNELQGHIIACVSTLSSDLIYFIFPLRFKCAPETVPIVFLTQQVPSEEDWEPFASFPDVWVVKGDLNHRNDLLKVNSHLARSIVLLNDTRNITISRTDDDKQQNIQYDMETTILEDATIIMNFISLNNTLSRNSNILILANLRNSNNMALFACRDADLEKSNTPEFGPLFSPYYAAGKLHSVSLLNSFLCRRYYNSHTMDMIEDFAKGQSYKMSLIPLPQGLEDACYVDLVTYLTQRKMIPLGLYCAPRSPMESLPFVYVSPSPNTSLHPSDRVYVFNFSSANNLPSSYASDYNANRSNNNDQ